MNRRNFIQSIISSLLAFLFLGKAVKSRDFSEGELAPVLEEIKFQQTLNNETFTISTWVNNVDSGKWYHICAIYDTDTPTASIRWYVNGKEVEDKIWQNTK